jgi:hypothetical protein
MTIQHIVQHTPEPVQPVHSPPRAQPCCIVCVLSARLDDGLPNGTHAAFLTVNTTLDGKGPPFIASRAPQLAVLIPHDYSPGQLFPDASASVVLAG